MFLAFPLGLPLARVSGSVRFQGRAFEVKKAVGSRLDVRTARGMATVTVPPETRNGRRLRLRGQGLADGRGGHGDAYVRLELDLPEVLSERERRLLDELAGHESRRR